MNMYSKSAISSTYMASSVDVGDQADAKDDVVDWAYAQQPLQSVGALDVLDSSEFGPRLQQQILQIGDVCGNSS